MPSTTEVELLKRDLGKLLYLIRTQCPSFDFTDFTPKSAPLRVLEGYHQRQLTRAAKPAKFLRFYPYASNFTVITKDLSKYQGIQRQCADKKRRMKFCSVSDQNIRIKILLQELLTEIEMDDICNSLLAHPIIVNTRFTNSGRCNNKLRICLTNSQPTDDEIIFEGRGPNAVLFKHECFGDSWINSKLILIGSFKKGICTFTHARIGDYDSKHM